MVFHQQDAEMREILREIRIQNRAMQTFMLDYSRVRFFWNRLLKGETEHKEM